MRLWHAVTYVLFVLVELVRGSLTLARDVLTPGLAVTPAVVELPLRCVSDVEISLLASSITITPGTLVVGTAAAQGSTPATLFVHCLYARDLPETVAGLRDMEDRLLRATRGRRAADEGSTR